MIHSLPYNIDSYITEKTSKHCIELPTSDELSFCNPIGKKHQAYYCSEKKASRLWTYIQYNPNFHLFPIL